ncbi:MAG: L,D-transpeptidase family protein [Blautia sp.]|nr:L,D-transpeptidase family protein [Blautia sp.]
MNKKKIIITVGIICLVLLAGAGTALGLYLRGQWKNQTYPDRTRINGVDASGMLPEEVLEQLKEGQLIPTVHINENNKEVFSATLEELGYSVDTDVLRSLLGEVNDRQRTSLSSMFGNILKGKSYRVTIPFTVDESTFTSRISAQSLSEPRIARKNAVLVYDEASRTYHVQEEENGTEFEDSDFQALVTQSVEDWMTGDRTQTDISVDITDSLYIKPEITKDDAQLNNLCNIYNQYTKASITYDFGSQTEVLDWNTIQNWLVISGDTASVNEDAAREYISQLAAKYNTIYNERVFHTSLGTDVTISGPLNEYGYRIDEEGELLQLLADIKSNTAAEREPVYSYSGYAREGTDDLLGTYVEVNLTEQHLWFYVNGALVVESDIVSGCVSKNTETQTGVFPLAYKESPSVLTGDDAQNGWRTEVQYWMPFFDGQGLHDATWRSSFGGNIYKTSGSHGCVNLPYSAAEQIYNNIDAGVAIILYK